MIETAGGVFSAPARHTGVYPMHSPEVSTRFWAKVDRDGPVPGHRPELGPCWVWTAGKFRKGYGQFQLNGRPHHASRVALEIASGPIPVGKCALHRCDNPPCVNPAHLWLGTHTDNMRDAAEKRRLVTGERHHNARLTASHAVAIRSAHRAGCSLRMLSFQFGVGTTAISDVVHHRTWAI